MKTKDELLASLPQFGGSETLQPYQLLISLTEGVAFLAKEAECFWLIDAIASYQPEIKKSGNQMLKDFQIWELTRQQECKFLLVCKEDSETPPAFQQEIEFSDFPLDEIKLWLSGGILLLPSEY
ncbi:MULTISPECIES: DUF6876 family protein [unclassified Microcoleus]|uniref:DUF6876 family protein n=1 Tax=unclassified Microcoleus TaxID=2642155 RepID=UPI001E16A5CB|nr:MULTISPECIES: DUF6876 family protein [unclassified Microcoleus]MCC3411594.1 hypothetical protein [Microcoleus sp. PH2017_02_FOX_O_A]MCC3516274.1 hypothetical protein [Microcoleus sp. PH2017_18_LLB_O_A]